MHIEKHPDEAAAMGRKLRAVMRERYNFEIEANKRLKIF